MNQKHNSQLLFIYPQDPLQSFYWNYEDNNSRLKEQTLGSLLEAIENQKQFYMDVTDVFGRSVPEESTEEFFKPLQPFYMTKIAYKEINLHISLPASPQKIDYAIDSDKNLDEVKKFVEQTTNIPTEKQKYFMGEQLLNDNVKLLNQKVCDKDVQIRLELKPSLTIKYLDETFAVYPELGDYVSQLMDKTCRKKKLSCSDFSLVYGGKELYEDNTLVQSGLKFYEVLTLEKKILVEIKGIKNSQRSFPCSYKISQVRKSLAKDNKPICGDSDGLLLYFGQTLAEDDKPLSSYKSLSIQFEVKPKADNLLVRFVDSSSPYMPALALLPCSSCLLDLKKLLFPNWLLEADIYEFWTKDKKVIKEAQILRELNAEGDILELGYGYCWKGFQIFVNTLTGKIITCTVSPCYRVEFLKLQIREKGEDVPPDQQRFTYAGRQLEDANTLAQYNIQIESRIHVLLRLQGGCSAGVEFADITKEDKAKSFEWSKSAPDWRMARRGLCLEGRCLNRQCGAHRQWVIINKGIGTYDVIYDQYQNKCPMCLKYVKVEKCAFNNCRYGYTGIKMQKGELPPQKVTSQEEIEVGDCYKLFDPAKTGKASWLSLKIVTKGLDDTISKGGAICGICREEVKINGRRLDCNHLFHDECLQKVKSIIHSCTYCHL